MDNLEHIIKSRHCNDKLTLELTEKLVIPKQLTSYNFNCSLESEHLSMNIENIIFDQADIEGLIIGFESYLKGRKDHFNSFPSYSDLILKIERCDNVGHHKIFASLENKNKGSKVEYSFEVDENDILKLISFFQTIIS